MKKNNQVIEGRLFNPREMGDLIGVCRRTISNMTRNKMIPYFKIGKSVRFDPAKVLNALNKYEVPAEEEA